MISMGKIIDGFLSIHGLCICEKVGKKQPSYIIIYNEKGERKKIFKKKFIL